MHARGQRQRCCRRQRPAGSVGVVRNRPAASVSDDHPQHHPLGQVHRQGGAPLRRCAHARIEHRLELRRDHLHRLRHRRLQPLRPAGPSAASSRASRRASPCVLDQPPVRAGGGLEQGLGVAQRQVGLQRRLRIQRRAGQRRVVRAAAADVAVLDQVGERLRDHHVERHPDPPAQVGAHHLAQHLPVEAHPARRRRKASRRGQGRRRPRSGRRCAGGSGSRSSIRRAYDHSKSHSDSSQPCPHRSCTRNISACWLGISVTIVASVSATTCGRTDSKPGLRGHRRRSARRSGPGPPPPARTARSPGSASCRTSSCACSPSPGTGRWPSARRAGRRSKSGRRKVAFVERQPEDERRAGHGHSRSPGRNGSGPYSRWNSSGSSAAGPAAAAPVRRPECRRRGVGARSSRSRRAVMACLMRRLEMRRADCRLAGGRARRSFQPKVAAKGGGQGGALGVAGAQVGLEPAQGGAAVGVDQDAARPPRRSGVHSSTASVNQRACVGAARRAAAGGLLPVQAARLRQQPPQDRAGARAPARISGGPSSSSSASSCDSPLQQAAARRPARRGRKARRRSGGRRVGALTRPPSRCRGRRRRRWRRG